MKKRVLFPVILALFLGTFSERAGAQWGAAQWGKFQSIWKPLRELSWDELWRPLFEESRLRGWPPYKEPGWGSGWWSPQSLNTNVEMFVRGNPASNHVWELYGTRPATFRWGVIRVNFQAEGISKKDLDTLLQTNGGKGSGGPNRPTTPAIGEGPKEPKDGRKCKVVNVDTVRGNIDIICNGTKYRLNIWVIGTGIYAVVTYISDISGDDDQSSEKPDLPKGVLEASSEDVNFAQMAIGLVVAVSDYGYVTESDDVSFKGWTDIE